MIVTDRPDILWRPSALDIDDANVTHFMSWLGHWRGITHTTWNGLWEQSVHELDAVWSAVWDYDDVAATRRADHIVSTEVIRRRAREYAPPASLVH
jgi:acetoacetyl-CoA synthetase